jgi:hypothetical protein
MILSIRARGVPPIIYMFIFYEEKKWHTYIEERVRLKIGLVENGVLGVV